MDGKDEIWTAETIAILLLDAGSLTLPDCAGKARLAAQDARCFMERPRNPLNR